MPNFFAAFQSEVFKPFVTLLIPGSLAISSWFFGLLWHFESLKSLVSRNHTETIFILLLSMLLFGLMIEDQGSRWETWLDKTANRRSNGKHEREWFEYLRTAFIADPIGRRYIRSIVLRLKFEFGVCIGLLYAAAGLLWNAWLGVSYHYLITVFILCIALSGLQLVEALSTHSLLARTRSEMLKPIRIVRVTNEATLS